MVFRIWGSVRKMEVSSQNFIWVGSWLVLEVFVHCVNHPTALCLVLNLRHTTNAIRAIPGYGV